MNDFIDWVGESAIRVLLFAGTLVATGIFCLAAISNRISFPGAVAEIEQLRADIAGLDPSQAEDVVGQATQFNQQIASAKAWNKIPVIGWTVPDGWESVEPIVIPKAAK